MWRHAGTLALVLATVACSAGDADDRAAAPNLDPPATTPPSDSNGAGSDAGAQKIVFWRSFGEQRRGLYLVNEDGTNVVAIADFDGLSTYRGAAPGGRLLFETYYPNERQRDLYSIRPDGTGLIALTGSQHVETFNAVAPSNRVIYTHQTTYDAQRDLHSVNTEGEERCIIAGTTDEERFVALTPDDRVLFARCREHNCALHVGDCARTELLAADNPTVIGVTPTGRVIYTLPGGDASLRRLYSVKTDGSDRRELGSVNVATRLILHRESVIWQQDAELVLAGADGGSRRTLAPLSGPVTRLAVTPDSRLVYQVGNAVRRAEANDVYSVRLDGSEQRALAASADIEFLNLLTPSGRVLYQRYPDAETGSNVYSLRSVSTNGEDDRALAESHRANTAEAALPNRRVVYLNSDFEARRDHHAVNDDGSDDRFLITGAKYEAHTRNQRIVFTTPCTRTQRFDPPLQLVCTSAAGDLIAMEADGTGVVSLASGSEPEGFAGLQ